MIRLLLASGSPRRRDVLSALRIPFETLALDLDERPRPGEAADNLAERLARDKASAGAGARPGWLSIGSDTVVALDRRPLGKPEDAAQARAMLRALRGRAHRVITAVAIARVAGPSRPSLHQRPPTGRGDSGRRTAEGVPERLDISRVSETTVWMRDYRDEEIETYIASGDPFDKAGAYAIQHVGFHPVERVEGCFLTVVGLPLPELRDLLVEAGASLEAVNPQTLASICPGCADRDRLSTGPLPSTG